MATSESMAREAPASENGSEEIDSSGRNNAGRLASKRLMPRTAKGFLTAIMLSALIPLLLLQTAIYFFWFRTRMQVEMDANTEFARSVAASFEFYVRDIRRQELIVGDAIHTATVFSLEYAGDLLTFLKGRYSSVIRFSLVDARGTIAASSNPRAVGLSVADQSYFRNIHSGQEWTISDLTEGPLINKSNFAIAQKVGMRDGSSGMVVAIIDPDAVGERMLPLDRPAEGVFTLFDRQGNLVYFGGAALAGHPNWKTWDPILRRALEGSAGAGIIIHPLDNKERVVARVPIRPFGWTAGAGRPVAAAMAPIYRNLAWVAVLNGAILIVSLGGAVGLSRFLIARLDQLRGHAHQIAGGNFSSKANVKNPVELAELESSFNVMAGQIQARQESLKKAITELTRSNQELEQFAYVASHDLQEPLRVIAGFVQLIEKKYKGRLDKETDRYMGFITDAVSRQQELIKDLLNISRVGRKELRLQPVDANKAADAALLNIREMVEDTHAEVTHDSLPVVQAEAGQLVQLFQNLIANGIKFRGPRAPAIHISANQMDGTWVFAVRDNGIGIESQYWDQIFMMFKRLHTRKEYPGTGIGLAICKKIVERHGGRIWVDSKPGDGSTFYFTLAAAENHDEFGTGKPHQYPSRGRQ